MWLFIVAILIFLGVLGYKFILKHNDTTGYFLSCFCLLLVILSLFFITSSIDEEDTTYYQPAEVTAYNDTCVFFTTPENNIYYIEKGDIYYSDDMLYLLHMDDMGTEDVTDDKIIVAWQCVE